MAVKVVSKWSSNNNFSLCSKSNYTSQMVKCNTTNCFSEFFFFLQLTVDDLAALPQIQTMANQIVTITVSNTVSVSDCSPVAISYTDTWAQTGAWAVSHWCGRPLFLLQGEILLGEKQVHLVTTNIVASNGIIHMINGLLYPPSILPILPHRCDVTLSKITLVSSCQSDLVHTHRLSSWLLKLHVSADGFVCVCM